MKKILKVLLYAVIIIVIVLLILLGLTCYELNQIRTTKDFIPITIENNEIVDYRDFAFCDGKDDMFKKISPECRAEVANYMYENNLKLKYGEYEFCKSNPTFDELVNENFKFEKITGQDVKKDNDNLSINIIFEKDINAGYVKKIIDNKKPNKTNLNCLNKVVLCNIYTYLKENKKVIKSGRYTIGDKWWFYNGNFYYDNDIVGAFSYNK